jgi:hypothetical protein
VLFGLLGSADAHDKKNSRDYLACEDGETIIVNDRARFERGVKKGWWTAGACIVAPPSPVPEPPSVVPQPTPEPAPRPTPPMPAPASDPPLYLPAGTVKDGPTLCKVFADVLTVDRLVVTNVSGYAMSCNAWRYRGDGSLQSAATFGVAARGKAVILPDPVFDGWWQVACDQTWKGARIRPVAEGGFMGVIERVAEACTE